MLYQIAQAIHSMRFRDAFPPQPGAAPDRRRHPMASDPRQGHRLRATYRRRAVREAGAGLPRRRPGRRRSKRGGRGRVPGRDPAGTGSPIRGGSASTGRSAGHFSLGDVPRRASCRDWAIRGSAALRAAAPAPTGRTGRRSALQAVPALLLRERYALSPRFAQRVPVPPGPHGENWPEAGVPSRPGASTPGAICALAALRAACRPRPAPTGRTGRRPAFQAVPRASARSAMRSISRLVRRTLDHLFQREVLEPPAGRAGIQGHAG